VLVVCWGSPRCRRRDRASDPAKQSLIEKRSKPRQVLARRDEFGRDILSRVIYGTRIALVVGVLSR